MSTPYTDTINGFVAFGATVLGAGQSWKLDTFFDVQPTQPLPCLLAVPVLQEQKGWMVQAYGGNAPLLEFMVEHYYLYDLVAGKTNFPHMMPGIDTAMDTYFTALKNDPMFLTANGGKPISHFPLVVRQRVARTEWFGQQYHSVAFQFDIKLNL